MDPESIVDLSKILVYDEEDSIIQEQKNKRQTKLAEREKTQEVVNLGSDSEESDNTPLATKRGTKNTSPTKMRYFTKTQPKKAGKQNVIDITNQIESWTPHTVTLKSGKVIRKSDIYKHLGTDPWPETDDAIANRQLIRNAACKTVAGQKRLDQTLRAEFAKFQKRKPLNPVWIKGPNANDNQLPDDIIRAPKGVTNDPATGEELPDALTSGAPINPSQKSDRHPRWGRK